MSLLEQIDILSKCKPTNLPFINLFLDTRETESGKRSCDRFLGAKYDFLHCEFLINGGNIQTFGKCWRLINDVLDKKLYESTRGLILILRPDPECKFIFIEQFKVPIENKIIVDGIPQITHVLELIDQKKIAH